MDRIIDNNREVNETMLFIVTIGSYLTFKRIKKLENYRMKLKAKLDIH